MSAEENKKHWIAIAPSLLTGLAALIAALTTVYINVRSDKTVAATPAPASVAAGPALAGAPVTVPAPPKPLPAQASTVELQLERMRVDNDGTMGTTDWTFEIRSGELSLFSVPFKGLADKAGENIVVPKDPRSAHANLVMPDGKPSEISVRGWKQTWAGKAASPEVLGQAKLNAGDERLVIEVKSAKAGGPAFVLYFNARSVRK